MVSLLVREINMFDWDQAIIPQMNDKKMLIFVYHENKLLEITQKEHRLNMVQDFRNKLIKFK